MSHFLKLYLAGIPTIIIIGNHDHPLSFGKAHSLDIFSDLPIDGFHVINKPKTITLETQHGPIQILGIPWPTRNTITLNSNEMLSEITTNLSKTVSSIIQHHADQLDQTIPSILACHLTVSNGIFSGSEKRAIYGTDPIFLPSQLAIKPFDYVALGHLHRYQNLNENGYPAIVYPGSIERIDFGERKEEKGFCLVSIEKKGTVSHTFVPTPTRPFIQIEVQLDEENQTENLIDEINKHAIKDAIIKIVYHLPENVADHVEIKKVQKVCQKAHYIVGLFPVKKHAKREQRAQVKLEMDLKTLLQTYFSQKPELADKIDHLIAQTQKIIQETEQDQ